MQSWEQENSLKTLDSLKLLLNAHDDDFQIAHTLLDSAKAASGINATKAYDYALEALSYLKKTKVIIVDDHGLVIEGLHSYLGEDTGLDVVRCSENTAYLFAFLERSLIHVELLDVNLPDMHGVEICRKITKKYSHNKVIGLSIYNDSSIIEQMVKNGALN